MDIFDGDGFDMEDAAIIGGIMGFAEESMREEGLLPDDVEEEIDVKEIASHPNLRFLYNENPGLVEHLLEIMIKQRKEMSEARKIREQHLQDLGEVAYELEAMKKSGVDDGDQ